MVKFSKPGTHEPYRVMASKAIKGALKDAGAIVAFHKFHEDLSPGDKGLICSFGAGYSVGSLLVERV